MNDIIINNSKVVISNTNLPPRQKHFKKMLKIGKLRFYVTWNYRLRNSQSRDNNYYHAVAIKTKEKIWKRSEGSCEICGKKIEKFSHAQMHHVLPWRKFRQYEYDERNVLLLCRDCHKSIHTNPFLDCKMQEEKAKKLGINLKDYYDV